MNGNLAYFLYFHLGSIVVGVLVLSSLGHMIYQRREPTSMTAWLLAILLLPYIAVPLYFIFRSRKLRRRSKSPIQLANRRELPEDQATQIDLILRRNGIAGATWGNHFHFLADGIRAYKVLMEHIHRAEKRIMISTYVFGRDRVAKSIISALTRKAADGVDVRLLIDSVGSLPLYLFQGPLRQLRRAGGQVAFCIPLLARPFQEYVNLRNHRKIFLFDDDTVLAGGMNLSREYMGPSYSRKRWIDLLFEIRGPAVFHYREIFTQDWNHSAVDKLAFPTRVPDAAGDIAIQVVPSGPDIHTDGLYEALLSALFAARKRIWIVTPYFVPDKSLFSAMVIARHRGVDVKLITPATSNHLIADLGRSSFMRDLEARGIDVCLFQNGMIHAKAILVDHRKIMMGSANIDQRSLFFNYEVVSLIYSEQVAQSCAAWMEQLMRQCEGRMAPAGRWRRMGENLMRIFAPLL